MEDNGADGRVEEDGADGVGKKLVEWGGDGIFQFRRCHN